MKLVIPASCAFLTLMLAACSPASGPKNTVNIVEKRAVLPNDLKLVVMPDPDNTMVQVDVRYEVGAKEDYPGRAGLAHLVEHMMFQHRFGPDEKPVEERLPTFQMLPHIATGFNAYTTTDTTHYWLQAPAEDAENLIRLEGARLAAGCSTIPEAQFEREREVVRNEIRQRLGTPEGAVLYEIVRSVYPKGHPYHEMVGGTDATLASITFDDVCRFMKEYYVPSRATLIVSGKVEPEAIGKMAMKYLGGIDNRTAGKLAEPKPITPSYSEKTIDAAIERDVVSVTFPLPPRTSDEYDAVARMLFTLSSIIDGFAKEWKIGRVFDSSRTGNEEKVPGLIPLGGAYAPVVSIQLELYPGKDPKEALGYIWKAVDVAKRYSGVLLEDGSYASEKLSKILFKQSMIQSFESLPARNGAMAEWIQFDKRLQPDFISDKTWMYEVLDRYGDVSDSKYKKVVKRVLDKSKATVLIVKSSDKGITGDERAKLAYSTDLHEDRATPPVEEGEWERPLSVPSSESILNKVKRFSLANGMDVMLLPYETMPVVKARLIVPTGSVDEKVSQAGLARAATTYWKMPNADVFLKTGVSIGAGAGMTVTTVGAEGLSTYLEPILRGIERLVVAGGVVQKDIEEYRNGYKRNFERDSFQRNFTYQLEISKALYGEEHPYTTKGSPDSKSINSIGRDAAMSFIRDHIKPKGSTLVVVGNFDADYARKIIEDNFGSHGNWSGGSGDNSVDLKTAARSEPAFIGVVGSENSPQVTLSIRYPSVMGSDDDYGLRLIAAQMLNKRMGLVRSKLGSTYGTYAGYRRAVGPTAYQIGGTIDASRAGESVKFIRDQVSSLATDESFNVEFAEARRVVFKKLIADSTETSAVMDGLTTLAIYGLEPSYYDQLVRSVAGATPAQVQTLIRNEIKPGSEVLAIMGPRDALKATFSEAGIQDPKIVEPKSF